VAFTLPRLPPGVVSPEFQVWWQQVVEAVESEVGALEAADAANAAAVAAAAAAAAANAAATAAGAAAATANTAAAAAQTTADDITTASTLANSYVTGLTLSAADAGADVTITISAHTRHYPQPDGSTVSVAVSGGTLTARAYSTDYFIYYDDPTRAGGAVTYQSTTSEATAAQTGDRHTVGEILTPAALAAATDGSGTRAPGVGTIDRSNL
jgi:hypothetical protein